MTTHPDEHGHLVHPTANTFWEYERRAKTVTTRSGRVGTNGRTTTKTFPKADAADADLDKKHFKKLRDGFVFRAAENPGPILLQAWLTSSYTGFKTIALDVATNTLAAARHTGDGNPLCELVLLDATTGLVRQTSTLRLFDIWRMAYHDGTLHLQSDDKVGTWEATKGRFVERSRGGMFQFLEFDLQAGRLLYSREHERRCVVEVLDLASGTTLLSIDAEAQRRVEDYHIGHVAALSPSGRWVALARQLGCLELYDLQKGQQRLLQGDFPGIEQLAFHPSEEWLAFTEKYGDWRFRVWSLDGKEDRAWQKLQYTSANGTRYPIGNCFDFALSPDGQTVALRDGATLHLHNATTRRRRRTIPLKHVARPYNTGGCSLHYARDGRLLTRTDCGVLTVYAAGS